MATEREQTVAEFSAPEGTFQWLATYSGSVASKDTRSAVTIMGPQDEEERGLNVLLTSGPLNHSFSIDPNGLVVNFAAGGPGQPLTFGEVLTQIERIIPRPEPLHNLD